VKTTTSTTTTPASVIIPNTGNLNTFSN
jgi:hypothetical protein